MEDSVFTKIIKGEIPCQKIYEDEQTLAFLDIYPVQPGHTLVIPKKQVDKLYDLDDELYQAVMAIVKKVAAHLEQTLQKRIGLKVEGMEVPHAHVHLIPFSTTEEFRQPANMSAQPDYGALDALAKRLRLE